MKLLTFNKNGTQTLGVKVEAGVIDVAAALEASPDEQIETDIMNVIEGGSEAIERLRHFIEGLEIREDYVLNEEEIKWEPAVTRPKKIICVGLNYKKHADETKSPYPKIPILFNKFENALTGHLSEIVVPRTTERLDHEVELGIVIGKTAKHVSEEEALDYVFGYCTTNDLSARDIQKRASQWMTGKTNDGFAPVGPYIVTKDEIENPNDLQITTTVNGEVRQNSNTADMIFNCEELISYISKYMTLTPGDLIMTGTPEGVILGRPMEERVYLQPGDKMTVEVERLGALTNTFVEDVF
ncbi:fumarylacetoacetate hydrolase family protein [Pseudogracilibacillus auburnensis]|uniref:2-keto-4-pentenoate hydratase/2-oxohepta-3-ene-1,7-dioic acid hydratase in catechol pathway n=1 Tax=Pseudogracilibacillus auburnensis TaxID=1494959 RepID=A0A2V3W4P7_9BACI|nr:fumarylacetoacetate hydrolase family protein [Pseudogracilibacillus auburnensis]MBO1004872.1 fumarylacetoacetate hydrolase family protein [Pseudogracilibacillus auburnensis]PXW88058.1 2-keto-4-pentenoate hydratase/2-oxohepta-3-ene-1,7-dioic acid hydratase in catechol pathway [Pseudogracilibacillus auburnensis]